MKRRDFLKKAGVAAAASATISPLMFASAQRGSFNFEMVTSWPTSVDTIFGGAQNVAKYVNELTDGDVNIEVYPTGAQVGGLEVYDAVSSGAFQMGHTASYYYIGKDPAQAFFTTVPFGLTAQQHNAWLYSAGGQALWDELNAQDDLIAFAAGNTGTQMGGWFRKEINTLEDVQGLKMRIPGMGGKVMAKAGANVQVTPGSEIFLSLERGVIDATEWVAPYDDELLGLPDAATYYYAPGWHEPSAALGTYVNLSEFEALPQDIQSAIRTASARANVQMLADYTAKNGEAYARILEGGTEPRTFSKEILDALNGYMDEIHKETIADNAFYAKVYEHWSAFRDNVRAFDQVADFAYNDYVYDKDTV